MKAALSKVISENGVYEPVPELVCRYRELFENRKALVRSDMKAAFSRLVRMREI